MHRHSQHSNLSRGVAEGQTPEIVSTELNAKHRGSYFVGSFFDMINHSETGKPWLWRFLSEIHHVKLPSKDIPIWEGGRGPRNL